MGAEPKLEQETSPNKKKSSTKFRSKAEKRLVEIRVKTPARNASEVPILATLAQVPGYSLKTKDVLKRVRKYFELGEDDLNARYPKSHQLVVNSIIKFSRKELVSKKQLYPIGEECQLGTWKLTPSGLRRARDAAADWQPRYTYRNAILLEELDVDEKRGGSEST